MKQCVVCGSNYRVRSHKEKGILCNKHYLQMLRCGRILSRTKKDKNEIVNRGHYLEIVLYDKNNNEKARAKVDKAEIELVKSYKWHLNNFGYVVTNRMTGQSSLLHVLIVGKNEDLEIDHINRNKLDNRRQNLRFVTSSQNKWNNNAIGVHFCKAKNKWIPQITVNGKYINLGSYIDKDSAIKARQRAVKKYFGKYASNI